MPKVPPMPWKIELIDTPPAIRVNASGPMKFVLIKQIAAEAIAEAAAHQVHRYLVDDREMIPQLSTLEIHELPDMMERMGLGKHDRVAVVYAESSPKAADFKFFEDTARNRGFDVQLFTDVNPALDWLRDVH